MIIGGVDMQQQARDLARRPHVVVATPGRLRVRPGGWLGVAGSVGITEFARAGQGRVMYASLVVATPGRLRVRPAGLARGTMAVKGCCRADRVVQAWWRPHRCLRVRPLAARGPPSPQLGVTGLGWVCRRCGHAGLTEREASAGKAGFPCGRCGYTGAPLGEAWWLF